MSICICRAGFLLSEFGPNLGEIGDVYKIITPIQLTNALWALGEGEVTFKAFRVYVACFELVAIREAAARSRKRQRVAGQEPVAFFRKEEILRLIGGKLGQSVAAELRALKEASLLTFSSEQITFTETPLPGSTELLGELSGRRSPARPIPVPRRAIKFIAACTRPSLSKTMLAYILRGLSIDRSTGEVKGRGAVKATWIADTFGLSLRAVRAARAKLMVMGWISKDTASKQWKLNRTGAYFEINCEWKEDKKGKVEAVRGSQCIAEACAQGSRGLLVAPSFRGEAAAPAANPQPEERRGNYKPRSAQAVDNLPADTREFAPPQGQNRPEFAPPYKYKKTSYEYKNQKTPTEVAAPAATSIKKESGFCMKKKEEGEKAPPNIRNVKLIDLKKPRRLQALYQEFVRVGELQPGEASAINFAAAAVRAGKLDLPDERRVKVFLGIIKRRLWGNITQAEEDRALSVIRRCREQEPGFLRAA